MSQEQSAQRGKPYRTFEQKSDATFRIILGVGVALVGALGLAQWASQAPAATAVAKPAVDVQAKTSSVDPVYRCNGRVSFKPCSTP